MTPCPICAACVLRSYAEDVPLTPWALADRIEKTAAKLRAGTITPGEAASRISNDAACVRLMEWMR